MAKWTAESSGSLHGAISPDDFTWEVKQDEKPFIEQAKLDREAGKKRDQGFKKVASIPDVVAIDIMSRFGLDIHDPEFMHDHMRVKRLVYLLKTEYPHLMSY